MTETKIKNKQLSTPGITDPASPEQGDVLYWNGVSWERLAHGTDGQALTTKGHGQNPQWTTISGTTVSGVGSTTFLDLTDTPNSYSGQAGKSVVVNIGENGLEFTTVSGGGGITRNGSTTNLHLAVWDGTNTDIIKDGGQIPSAAGDVLGPNSSVDSNIVVFDGTSGKNIKDSSIASASLVTTTTLSGYVQNTGTLEQGDILYYTGSNWVSLSHGTTGQVLTTGGHGNNPYWTTVSGTTTSGTGLSAIAYPLDSAPVSPHASNDEFNGTTLDGKWTNPATSTRTISYTIADGYIIIEPSEAGTASISSRGGVGIRQNSPSGSFTVTAKMHMTGGTGEGRMGIFVASTSDNKCNIMGLLPGYSRAFDICGLTYNEGADWGAYDGYNSLAGYEFPRETWLKLVYDSGTGNLSFYYSQDGFAWKYHTVRAAVTQPNRMGIAIWSNSTDITADKRLACDWFRVTEP